MMHPDSPIMHKKDLRGIACPLNFVKAKLALEEMCAQEFLEILLDPGDPIKNVPAGLRGEGYDIVSIRPENGYFRVMIKK